MAFVIEWDFLVCFFTPTMSLIEIQMKSEDKINGDKLGAPSGAAAPLTHMFCSKNARKYKAKLESLNMPRCWRCLAAPQEPLLRISPVRARIFPSSQHSTAASLNEIKEGSPVQGKEEESLPFPEWRAAVYRPVRLAWNSSHQGNSNIRLFSTDRATPVLHWI